MQNDLASDFASVIYERHVKKGGALPGICLILRKNKSFMEYLVLQK